MFFTIFLIVSFKFNYYIDENIIFHFLPFTFYYQAGGNYTFNIKSNGTDKYIFQIAPGEKIDQYWDGKDLFHPCDNISKFENLHFIQIQDGKANFTGIIENDSECIVSIRSCSYLSSSFEIDLALMNPNSCLSAYDQNVLKKFQYLIIISVFLFLIWIINWALYFTFHNFIHLLITAAFLMYIIDISSFYSELKHRNISDEYHSIFSIHQTLQYIYRFTRYLFISFTETGFGILFEKVEITVLLRCFLVSVFLVIPVVRWYFYIFYFLIGLLQIQLYINACDFFESIEENNSIDMYQTNFMLSFCYFVFRLYFSIQKEMSFGDLFLNDMCEILFLLMAGILFFLNKRRKFNYLTEFKYILKTNISKVYFPPHLTKVDDKMFSRNDTIKSITFCENLNLLKIGKFAFSHTNIEYIKIPASVTEIGNRAFWSCKKIKTVEFEDNSELFNVEQCVFIESAIEEITFPHKVEELNVCLFAFCHNLKKVDFSENSQLKVIHDGAFKRSSIEYLSLPEKVETLEPKWCFFTPNLNTVEISPKNKNFKYYNDEFIIKKNGPEDIYDILLFAPRNIKNVVIPSFITKIASCAFQACNIIETLEFSNHSQLLYIDPYAFNYSSVNSIVIPNSVVIIDANAFSYCDKIEKFHFEYKPQLRMIENNAFKESSLKSFSITSKVIKVGENAFANCHKLQIVEIADDSELCSINFSAFSGDSDLIVMIPCDIKLKVYY